MIAEIGIIIGLYIITRMWHLVRTDSGKSGSVVRILGVLTIVVTTFVVLDLALRGLTTPLVPSL